MSYPLDTTRVVAVGCSAGGYLALWLGNRSTVATTASTYSPQPLSLRGVVRLGASGVLTPRGPVMRQLCEMPALERLFSEDSTTARTRRAEANPADLPRSHVPQRVIVGDRDEFVSPAQPEASVARARAEGEMIEATLVPGVNRDAAGNPRSTVWPTVRTMLGSMP